MDSKSMAAPPSLASRVAAILGAVVGLMFFFAIDSALTAATPTWLVIATVPGVVLLWPILLITGGVHGVSQEILALAPITNAFAYWGIAKLVARFTRRTRYR